MRKQLAVIAALALSTSAHALTLSGGADFLNGANSGNAWQITDTLSAGHSGPVRYGATLGLVDFGRQTFQHNTGPLPGYKPSPIAAYLPPSGNTNLASVTTRAVFALAHISGRDGRVSTFAGMGPALYAQTTDFLDGGSSHHTGLGLMADVGIAYHFGGWHVQASLEHLDTFGGHSDNAIMIGLGVTL